MRRKTLALILVVVATVSVVVVGYSINRVIHGVKDASIEEVISGPQSFDEVHVQLRGYIVNTSVYMFGPKHMLMGDEGAEIALGGKSGSENVDLELYVSFILDGKNYTRIRNLKVIVVGYVHYVGFVTDAPPFYLEVETVKEASLVTEDNAVEISRKAKLVKEGLATHKHFSVETSFYNYSWVKNMKTDHAREIYEKVLEGHDIWQVVWTFYNMPGGYTVIVIVDAETGKILHETKGVGFG